MLSVSCVNPTFVSDRIKQKRKTQIPILEVELILVDAHRTIRKPNCMFDCIVFTKKSTKRYSYFSLYVYSAPYPSIQNITENTLNWLELIELVAKRVLFNVKLCQCLFVRCSWFSQNLQNRWQNICLHLLFSFCLSSSTCVCVQIGV